MPQELTREALHALVWSQPMQKVSKEFGLSDRGLAKICAAADIPVPARGYWAKLQAGHEVSPLSLPPRRFGQLERVCIGRSDWPYQRESDSDILNASIPPVPVFEPDIHTVRTQVTALVRTAPLTLGDSDDWHSEITKLLAADEDRARKRRASPYPSAWDGPIFNTLFETRRLRILSALFFCLTRCGTTPHLSGKQGRELSVTVGDMLVHFTLDAATAAKLMEREREGHSFIARGEKDRMRLSLSSLWAEEPNARCWEDGKNDRVERHLREIVVEMIASAVGAHRRLTISAR